MAGTPTYGNITLQVNQTTSSTIFVTATLPYLSIQTSIASAITSHQLSFTFNTLLYTATFNPTFGTCTPGTISPNGYAPGCSTCPANTYVWLFDRFVKFEPAISDQQGRYNLRALSGANQRAAWIIRRVAVPACVVGTFVLALQFEG